MENSTKQTTRSIDVTGLPEDVIRAMEFQISLLRGQKADHGKIDSSSSREEWIQAIRAWAESHPSRETSADWSRESIYAGRGE